MGTPIETVWGRLKARDNCADEAENQFIAPKHRTLVTWQVQVKSVGSSLKTKNLSLLPGINQRRGRIAHVVQKILNRLAGDRMAEFRRDFGQRRERESTQMQSRVR